MKNPGKQQPAKLKLEFPPKKRKTDAAKVHKQSAGNVHCANDFAKSYCT